MAKIIKATILMLSEAPDGRRGVAGKAIAKYIVGDDADASVNQVKFKQLAAPDLSLPAGELFEGAVAAIKREEGVR